MKKTALFMLVLSSAVIAKDLGTHGALFDIKEISLLEIIQKKLAHLNASGDILKHQKIIQQRVQKTIENPPSVKGLQKATSYRSYFYDPTIVVGSDIKDLKRNILAKKGQRVNPLETVSLKKDLLFIDGNDVKQVSWALNQKAQKNAKIILVAGKPLDLMDFYHEKFYVDQSGVLSQKFDLKAVPAKISQRGLTLLVEEIPLEGNR
jgi:conjugal transfer pilus assembly protein TraW